MRPAPTRVRPIPVVTCVALAGLGLTAAAAALLRGARRVEVAGRSMLPTLLPDDRLAVLPMRPRQGRLVVVRDPRLPQRILVKRCAAVRVDGAVGVVGDNPGESTDSRHFGDVPADLVLGRPVHRYQPGSRAGWVLRA